MNLDLKDTFVQYIVIMIKKSNEKGNETFTTLIFFWIGKLNLHVQCLY